MSAGLMHGHREVPAPELVAASIAGGQNSIVTEKNQQPISQNADSADSADTTAPSTADESIESSSTPVASAKEKKRPRFAFPVIGIGASAGGLESLEKLFGELRGDSQAAFVVVQHLSPDFKSMMDEILRRRTDLTVSRIEHNMQMQPTTVYLIPPNADLELEGDTFKLRARDISSGISHPIDRFFKSLAVSRGASCAAVVCSGSGSDGSRGIRDVCEQGGMVLVEDPESAHFDDMPRAAVDSGIVDFVAPIGQLAIWLGRFIDSFNNKLSTDSDDKFEMGAEEFSGIKAVTTLLRSEYGIDFLQYKPNMILRRIERRLQMVPVSSIDQYVSQLKADPEELNQLYRDLLIGVTRFFRDRDAFEALSGEVLPPLVESSHGRTMRVWTPGCATGEETYSLAIRISEAFEQAGRKIDCKIFATDAHPLSLEKASNGVYSHKQLTDVPEHFLEKYFEPVGEDFRVKQNLRKMVVFAPHNLLEDASFTKVDLVICRNTLIYFKLEGQRRALALMHFGLRTGGFLFLGPSETPGQIQEDYKIVNRRWRIYRKVANSYGGLTDLRVPKREEPAEQLVNVRSNASVRADKLILTALESMAGTYVPSSFVTDADFRLLYSTMGAASFLRRQSGKFDATLPDLLLPAIKTTVLIGLQRAARDNLVAPVSIGTVTVPLTTPSQSEQDSASLNGDDAADDTSNDTTQQRTLRVIIRKVMVSNDHNHGFLVTLETVAEQPVDRPSFVAAIDTDVRSSLENELKHTKENLQSSIEALESSNEELQATNEEMVASNEELQSTNEELHSVNEELYTVNSEHQNKIEELTELTEDMENLFRASDTATIFLDESLQIRRVTPKASQIFSLTHSDIGRPLENFRNPLQHDDLYVDIANTIKTSTLLEREVMSQQGGRHLMRLLPYSSAGDNTGVVLTLIDLSRLEESRQRMETREARFRGTFENAAVGIAHVEFDGTWLRVNERLCEIVGHDREELLKSNFQAIAHPEDLKQDLPKFEDLKAGKIESYSARNRCIHKDGREVYIDLTVSLQSEPGRDEAYYIVFVQDATQNVESERQLADGLKQHDQFLAVLSHELRNPLASLRNAVQLLQRTSPDEKDAKQYVSVLDRQTEHMTRLVEDLLDTSRITRNQIKFQRELIDMKSLVKESVDSMRSGFTIKKQTIELEIEGDSFPVVGDQTRLLQVFENLLSNSRRYTQPGGAINVWLRVETGRAVLSVHDNGPGIAPSKIGEIFKMFTRAHETQETQGGLGIGLALAKMLMEQHDGDISVESEGVGKGATFTISLPLVPVPKTGVVKLDSQLPVEHANNFSIVLVDDDDDARLTMKALLELDGHAVTAASDGLEGLAMISDKKPKFALVDLSMPGLSGIELANRLNEDGHSSILVALTGHGQPHDRDRTQAAGFSGHLVKPVDMNELNQLMDTLSEKQLST